MNDENEGIIAFLTKTIENNWRLLLVGIIIIAIALNSFWSDNKSSEENKTSLTPQAEQPKQSEQSQQAEQNKPEEKTQKTENESANTAQAKETEVAKTNSDANTFIQVAAKSEGITHLARRTIKEYLNNINENLSAEQKIYAEDYLKKKIGSRKLAIGEKIEFSAELVKQSIEQSKSLSEKQIKNLSKYVPLAKNLN